MTWRIDPVRDLQIVRSREVAIIVFVVNIDCSIRHDARSRWSTSDPSRYGKLGRWGAPRYVTSFSVADRCDYLNDDEALLPEILELCPKSSSESL